MSGRELHAGAASCYSDSRHVSERRSTQCTVGTPPFFRQVSCWSPQVSPHVPRVRIARAIPAQR